MMSSSKISGSGYADYMTSDSAVEYYAGEKTPSEWMGKGAELQGLKGEVTKEDLKNQLEGRVKEVNPESGKLDDKQLGTMRKDENGESKLQHNQGIDLTNSAPKSISIESEVFGNKEVADSFDKGNQKAMEWLENECGKTRIDGETVNTGSMTIASIKHTESRAGEPNLHRHNLIMNSTHDENGKAYSLAEREIYNNRSLADSIAKLETAKDLNENGYATVTEKNGKELSIELAGSTKEERDVFSSRTNQIKENLEKMGVTNETATPAQKEFAKMDGRSDKDHSKSEYEIKAEWKEKAEANGVKQAVKGECKVLTQEEKQEIAKEVVQSSMNHHTEKEMAFTERNLKIYAVESALQNKDKIGIDDIEKAIDDAKSNGQLIQREDGKYTTKDCIDAEKNMEAKLINGKNDHEAVMTPKEFDKAVEKFEERKLSEEVSKLTNRIDEAKSSGKTETVDKLEKDLSILKENGWHLKDEQVNASKMILCNDDRFQGIQGDAGTGKTTMLEFVREAAEAKGYEVQGISNGKNQASNMEKESGIKSDTTAKYLINYENDKKGSDLSQKALDTYEKSQNSMYGNQPNFKELDKGVDKGTVEKAWADKLDKDGNQILKEDGKAEKRTFYVDKESGNVYCKDLYQGNNSLHSANVNHLGLTESKYMVTDKGDVFKSGGSVGSEIAGALKDNLSESRANQNNESKENFLDKASYKLANEVYTKGENWKPVSGLEASIVKDTIADRNNDAIQNTKDSLQASASKMDGENKPVLLIMDEASMSGQREFNKVCESSENTGKKTVFLGDSQQHQAVEAGKSFELAQNHMPMAELHEITRQKTDHTKEAVSKIIDGKVEEAYKSLDTKEVSTKQQEVTAKYAEKETLTPEDKKAFQAEMKEARKEDNKEVIKEIAKDYSSMDKPERDKTLVITATNADKNSISSEIRDELKSKGEIKTEGVQIDTLQKTDMSKEEKVQALSYEKGQIIEIQKDIKSQDVQKGDQFTVTKTSAESNLIFAKNETTGKEIAIDPKKIDGKVDAYNEVKGKEFSEGDRVVFTKNDAVLGYENNQKGTITSIDKENKTMSLKLDNGEERKMSTDTKSHIDHAYAVTSHKSQGQTVDKALIHHNTEGGKHGDRETYVNVTRVREDVKIYTQDSEKASSQAGIKMDKESANLPSSDLTKNSGKEAPLQDNNANKGASNEGKSFNMGSGDIKASEIKSEKSSEKKAEVSKTEQPNSSVKENKENSQSQSSSWDRGR